MISLDELEAHADPAQLLLPLDTGLSHFPAARLNAEGLAAFRNGQPGAGQWLETGSASSDLVRIYNQQDQFIGLGTENGVDLWSPKRVLQL